MIFFSKGSPAEKADLEVADEILEVNGESLENSNHTDVIAHIHNVKFKLRFELRKVLFWPILKKIWPEFTKNTIIALIGLK